MKLSEHELFDWIGNHGIDIERPGYPQAMALDLKIMIDALENDRDALLAVKKAAEYVMQLWRQDPQATPLGIPVLGECLAALPDYLKEVTE